MFLMHNTRAPSVLYMGHCFKLWVSLMIKPKQNTTYNIPLYLHLFYFYTEREKRGKAEKANNRDYSTVKKKIVR